ncbi:MAG: PilZ domain-containing protein [Pseudomonadota bacterium]
MGSERRRYERRELKAEVYCYIEGQRVDVRSSDISQGGMFIETGQPVLPGTELAVVVKAQLLDGRRPVFLTARVMRRQAQPVKGIGIRWERATTPGDAEMLREFLRSSLGIDPRGIEELPQGDAGMIQAVYVFPLGTEDFKGAPVVEEAPPLLGGGEDTIEGLDDEEATLQDVDEALQAELAARRRPAGPLTQELAQGSSQAPADLKATLVVGKNERPVRISSLGPENAFITTNTKLEPGARLELRFGIAARGGVAEVQARADVISVGRDHRSGRRGVLVKLTRVDEGGHRGILLQYIRWLHFNSIRKPTV